MARTVTDTKLDSRSARSKLKARKEPYFRTISEGLAVGYRKGTKGGTWVARHYSAEHGRRYEALGTADDIVDADGVHVLSFGQAQEAARKWFGELAFDDSGEVAGRSYTVRDAMADYLKDYIRRGGKAQSMMENYINTHINPKLGDKVVGKLTRKMIESWLDGIANSKPRARTRAGEQQRYHEVDMDDKESIRKRRSTANRIFTVLKSGLNHAYYNNRVARQDAWKAVKPFREVDAPKVRYLNDEESVRLINACPEDFRQIVTVALLTGARYGEICALTAKDFDAQSNSLYIAQSKSGKPRHIHLTDEGTSFFVNATAGLKGGDTIFLRKTGAKWKHAEQSRAMKAACEAANIIPGVGFHVLRHTYGSRLAMRGVQLTVIAAQLGHSDTRITERHYAHLAKSYVGDTVRAAFGTLGIAQDTNVVTITSTKKKHHG